MSSGGFFRHESNPTMEVVKAVSQSFPVLQPRIQAGNPSTTYDGCQLPTQGQLLWRWNLVHRSRANKYFQVGTPVLVKTVIKGTPPTLGRVPLTSCGVTRRGSEGKS